MPENFMFDSVIIILHMFMSISQEQRFLASSKEGKSGSDWSY